MKRRFSGTGRQLTKGTSQAKLGTMLSEGRGVAQSDEEAVQWYRKAADQENAGAQCILGLTNVKSDKEAQTLVTWAWYGKRIDT